MGFCELNTVVINNKMKKKKKNRSFLFGAGVKLTKPPSTRRLFAKSAPDRRIVA